MMKNKGVIQKVKNVSFESETEGNEDSHKRERIDFSVRRGKNLGRSKKG